MVFNYFASMQLVDKSGVFFNQARFIWLQCFHQINDDVADGLLQCYIQSALKKSIGDIITVTIHLK